MSENVAGGPRNSSESKVDDVENINVSSAKAKSIFNREDLLKQAREQVAPTHGDSGSGDVNFGNQVVNLGSMNNNVVLDSQSTSSANPIASQHLGFNNGGGTTGQIPERNNQIYNQQSDLSQGAFTNVQMPGIPNQPLTINNGVDTNGCMSGLFNQSVNSQIATTNGQVTGVVHQSVTQLPNINNGVGANEQMYASSTQTFNKQSDVSQGGSINVQMPGVTNQPLSINNGVVTTDQMPGLTSQNLNQQSVNSQIASTNGQMAGITNSVVINSSNINNAGGSNIQTTGLTNQQSAPSQGVTSNLSKSGIPNQTSSKTPGLINKTPSEHSYVNVVDASNVKIPVSSNAPSNQQSVNIPYSQPQLISNFQVYQQHHTECNSSVSNQHTVDNQGSSSHPMDINSSTLHRLPDSSNVNQFENLSLPKDGTNTVQNNLTDAGNTNKSVKTGNLEVLSHAIPDSLPFNIATDVPTNDINRDVGPFNNGQHKEYTEFAKTGNAIEQDLNTIPGNTAQSQITEGISSEQAITTSAGTQQSVGDKNNRGLLKQSEEKIELLNESFSKRVKIRNFWDLQRHIKKWNDELQTNEKLFLEVGNKLRIWSDRVLEMDGKVSAIEVIIKESCEMLNHVVTDLNGLVMEQETLSEILENYERTLGNVMYDAPEGSIKEERAKMYTYVVLLNENIENTKNLMAQVVSELNEFQTRKLCDEPNVDIAAKVIENHRLSIAWCDAQINSIKNGIELFRKRYKV